MKSSGSSILLSCSTVAFEGYDLERALEGVAAAGFEWVEPAFIEGYAENFRESIFEDEKAEKLRLLLSRCGLRCSGVSAHIDLGKTDSLERIERRIRYCEAVGSPRVITNAAGIPGETQFYRNMDRIVPLAERAGVVLCLENPGDGRPNVVDDGASAAAVAGRLGSPFVRINYDGGNTFSHFGRRFAAESDCGLVGEWMEQIHVKDVRRLSSGTYEYPELGEGEIVFPTMAAGLVHSKSVKVLSLEVPLRMRRNPDASPYRIARVPSVDNIVAALGRSRARVLVWFRDILG